MHHAMSLFMSDFCLYSLCLPMEGWRGWVSLGGWLHTEIVYSLVDANGHPSKY